MTEMSAAMAKPALDLGYMAQDGSDTAAISGGGSSAMAHKVNPVDTELLVALARFVAALNGGLAQAALHENERSGAAWTLEWLTLPPIVNATGGAIQSAIRLLGKVQRLGRA